MSKRDRPLTHSASTNHKTTTAKTSEMTGANIDEEQQQQANAPEKLPTTITNRGRRRRGGEGNNCDDDEEDEEARFDIYSFIREA